MIVFDTETTGLPLTHSAPLESQPKIIEIAVIKLDFDMNEVERFEALVNPYILGDKSIYDNEPHPSASAVRAHITKTTSDGQVPFNKNNNSIFQKYTLAMNNFVAETVNFFMEGGNLSSFKSRTGPFFVRGDSVNKKHKMRFYEMIPKRFIYSCF